MVSKGNQQNCRDLHAFGKFIRINYSILYMYMIILKSTVMPPPSMVFYFDYKDECVCHLIDFDDFVFLL